MASPILNDVALIKLPTAVTQTTNIQTIKILPTSIISFAGNLTASGWGRTCDTISAVCKYNYFNYLINHIHIFCN
jgi:hypothetical protein